MNTAICLYCGWTINVQEKRSQKPFITHNEFDRKVEKAFKHAKLKDRDFIKQCVECKDYTVHREINIDKHEELSHQDFKEYPNSDHPLLTKKTMSGVAQNRGVIHPKDTDYTNRW